MKLSKIISTLLSVFAPVLLCACTAENNSAVQTSELKEGMLAVHFFDVGQGDSEFIEFPNGSTMLIDAGETDAGKTVVADIKNLGCSEITYVVATHPHSDHIGGLPDVFDSFEVKNLYLPDAVSTSYVYQNLLDAAEKEQCSIIEAENGVTVIDGEKLTVRFIAPVNDNYDDLNNYSAVLKVSYCENSFLFMGDAEEIVESEITSDVSADVIKVGHHGSRTSSSESFVKRVHPKYAVFEVGRGNSYGHPHEEIVDRWSSAGAEILRTDESGNITIMSDGTELTATADKENAKKEYKTEAAGKSEYKWVLNTSSKKIHRPSCSSVSKIASSNLEYSEKSISELENQGYKCCKSCNPGE